MFVHGWEGIYFGTCGDEGILSSHGRSSMISPVKNGHELNSGLILGGQKCCRVDSPCSQIGLKSDPRVDLDWK